MTEDVVRLRAATALFVGTRIGACAGSGMVRGSVAVAVAAAAAAAAAAVDEIIGAGIRAVAGSVGTWIVLLLTLLLVNTIVGITIILRDLIYCV